ncbi:alpha/beta hydrolase [Frigidibacter sp. ROC022]|uniref:alpha/beta hydrolase n=1 Tax=Frigidibacter sp. ROC022 TaxID=2971796 RepID=UPI00215AFE65|nr:alpha/beta hydrolase [Frigidibacter sp. ROC022]MCR8726725.1 alpha/beta hydrolase [Frigidibacter sp. ROC022]
MTDLAQEALLPRDEIDRDYTARLTATPEEFTRIIDRYASESAAARRLPGTRLDLPYAGEGGPCLDLFGTAPGAARPLFVFIHGGYWRALSKNESAFMAPMLAEHGIATAAIDYSLAPAAGMTRIVGELREALAWLWHNAESLGIDRNRIVVGGSSAGGHLAAMLLSPGWQKQHDLPEDAVAGALPVSGLFELAPIAASHVQEWMQLTEQEVADFSPLRHLPAGGRVTLAMAERETAGFHRQSRVYAKALAGAGVSVRLLEIPDRNHFDVILTLLDPQSTLSRALLELFGD